MEEHIVEDEDAASETVQWESLTDTENDGTSGTSDPSTVAVSSTAASSGLTYRPAIMLYLSCDPDYFSEFQVTVRKSLEFFEAQEKDITALAQGRNKPIVLGQVGVRCVYCRSIPLDERSRGAVYYPSRLMNVYQASQDLTNTHLLSTCQSIPDSIRRKLIHLRENDQGRKSAIGKEGWGYRAKMVGVYEDSNGLRFAPSLNYFHKSSG